jgi:hypothetical protein
MMKKGKSHYLKQYFILKTAFSISEEEKNQWSVKDLLSYSSPKLFSIAF